MKFKIEQQIDTLATNALLPKEGMFFEANGIKFSHWDFNLREGWLGNAWVAEEEIEASTYSEATADFEARLNKVIPRIAFVSQCYVEASRQSFLVTRQDSSVAVARYSKSIAGTGLMFMEREREALDRLLDGSVANDFSYIGMMP